MSFLKVVSSSLTLFNKITPSSNDLSSKGKDLVLEEIQNTLDEKNLLSLVFHFRKQIVDVYPNLAPVTWKILDSCLKNKHYKATLLLAFKVVENIKADPLNIYLALANSWVLMNASRHNSGDVSMPFNKNKPAKIADDGLGVCVLVVNGNTSPIVSDIKAVGAFAVLTELVKASPEEFLASEMLLMVHHTFFILLKFQGLVTDQSLEDTEEDKDIAYDFYTFDFESGIDLLIDLIDGDDDYLSALEHAIVSTLNHYNLLLTFDLSL